MTEETSARAKLTVKPDGIQLRSFLWVNWTQIAIDHEAMALAARQEAQQHRADWEKAQREQDGERQTKHGTDMALALGRETNAGLVGICAAAFALESLSLELRSLGAIPPETLRAWTEKKAKKEGPAAEDIALNVLAHMFETRGLYSAWQGELRWLFDLRGNAVHYRGVFEATEPHPVGTDVAATSRKYSAEETMRAVDLLLGILERCRDRPKSAGKQWSRDWTRIIGELIDRRAATRPAGHEGQARP